MRINAARDRSGRVRLIGACLKCGGRNAATDSFHPGGVNILLGDGSVRFVKDTLSGPTWRALGTLRGGEVLSADSY